VAETPPSGAKSQGNARQTRVERPSMGQSSPNRPTAVRR
jgi:hypothetical protein